MSSQPLFYFLFTAAFVSCGHNHPVDLEFNGRVNEGPKTKSEILSGAQGSWHCVDTENREVSEWSIDHPWFIPATDLVIKGDSVETFEYPVRFYSHSKLLGKNHSESFFDSLYFRHDTMVLRNHAKDKLFYTRKNFNTDTLDLLRRDTVCAAHLQGKWYLVKRYLDGYSGEPAYEIKYPVKVPLGIDFDRVPKWFSSKGTVFYLPVNGIVRAFTIEKIMNREPTLTLKAMGWWKKEELSIEYIPAFNKDPHLKDW